MKNIFRKSKLIICILIVGLICSLVGCTSDKETNTIKNNVIKLSTTTSVNDSGLLPYLQPEFEKDTKYKLEITSAGTGAAIEKGRTGDADCLLVHAKADEEKFINEGYGIKRNVLMYNYFIIIGPKDDPAKIKGLTSASEAFKKIMNSKSVFVSRGDDSGTNKKELNIWNSIDFDPTTSSEEWYVSTGQGMGASITVADEMQGYILTDKATYLSHNSKEKFDVMVAESEELKNTYSLIAINPEKWSSTNIDGANEFINWMLSDKAKKLIEDYGVDEYGENLFYIQK